MVVINGAQETPPNPSLGVGTCILTYDTATDTLCYYLSHAGPLAGGEIAADIHVPAAPGVPAGVILALPLGNPKTGCVIAPVAPFNKKDLFKNRYYVNIHSAGFPGGGTRDRIGR